MILFTVKHIMYHSATEKFRELIFNGGLYLTAEGYDLAQLAWHRGK